VPTNILVYYDFRGELPLEVATVSRRLEQSTPACRAVEAYWRQTESKQDPSEVWTFSHQEDLYSHNELYFAAPGSIYLSVRNRLARVTTGARWRGYLSIPGLHAVHLQAFRMIGVALGSSRMVITNDFSDECLDCFLNGKSLDDCISTLRAVCGKPEEDCENVTDDIKREALQGVPSAWYTCDLA
jgi:hypothetical protein